MQLIGIKFGKNKSFEEMVETAASNLKQKINSSDSTSISQPLKDRHATAAINNQRIESVMESKSVEEYMKIAQNS